MRASRRLALALSACEKTLSSRRNTQVLGRVTKGIYLSQGSAIARHAPTLHFRPELTWPQIGGEIIVPLLQFRCDISRRMIL